MASIPTLETERLVLRPFRPADAETVTELINDRSVSATLETIPFPYYRKYADLWIPTHAPLFENARELHLAIELRASNELLGAVSLLRKDRECPPHLGYWLGRRYWGSGYATEAVREIVRYANCQLGDRAVTARCMIDNPASTAVLAKVGLLRVGRCQQPVIKDGRPREVDEFLLELGNEERAV
jgi:RimJ/RimL family protein N-acetyltransferase